jgi:hypothetical protein
MGEMSEEESRVKGSDTSSWLLHALEQGSPAFLSSDAVAEPAMSRTENVRPTSNTSVRL